MSKKLSTWFMDDPLSLCINVSSCLLRIIVVSQILPQEFLCLPNDRTLYQPTFTFVCHKNKSSEWFAWIL